MKRIWLQQFRIAKGLSQKEVAIAINRTEVYYGFIENGKRNPSVELAQLIAEFLGFDWRLFYPKKTFKNRVIKKA